MKKLFLTSLLAFTAVSGAQAANVIDGNPLYMPKAGHFYSVTTLDSHSEGTPYVLAEEFGYGVMDNLAVNIATSLAENEAFDNYGWDGLALKATFRAFDDGAWKADIYGGYAADGYLYAHSEALKLLPAIQEDYAWFDKHLIQYVWTAGVRGGYTTGDFTIAGHIAYEYVNAESFNWGDYGNHVWKFGLDGQFVIDSNWNLVGGVEYTGVSNDKVASYDKHKGLTDTENEGVWTGYLGLNYNIDATKYVGAYVRGSMDHWKDDVRVEKGWDVEKGFGYGVKFGIDF